MLFHVYFLKTLRQNTPPGNPERGGGAFKIPDWTDLTIPTPNFVQRITRKICDCGKECKNLRGLKIHQAKIKCMDERGHMLRTSLRPGETKEVHGQDSHHSAQSLHAIDRTTPYRVNYKQIKGASAKCNNEWIQFDEDVSAIIQTTLKGKADRRLNVLSAIIVSCAKEIFGLREGKQEKTGGQRRCRT